MTNQELQPFPIGLFRKELLPAGCLSELIVKLNALSLKPPYPWGQWLYAQLIESHCANLAGDMVECGVAKGGMSIFLGHLAQPLHKKVFACDSFAGLPAPDPARDNLYFQERDYQSSLRKDKSLYDRFIDAVNEHELSDTIAPLKGFFADSLSHISPDTQICFLHIDADLYSSMTDVLTALYDRVVEGGVIVIDDYFHHAQGPKRAASDFFNQRGIYPLYHVSFPYTVFLIKGERSHMRHQHRSIDGNYYSFEYLKRDRVFVGAVETYLAEMAANPAYEPRQVQNCETFLQLLKSSETRSSDIYMYWKTLEDYWDRMSLHGILSGAYASRNLIEL